MSTITVSQEIETARGSLAPHFDALREDQTALFWEAFGESAARYRSARSEGRAAQEFAGSVRELEREARGTLAGFPREVPPMPSRAPWATMPTDGSGRMGPAERILYAVTGTLCLVVLVVVGFLASGAGSSPDAPDAGDSRSAARVVSDADMITQGGYWSWQVADGCGRGPAECHTVLRQVNAEAAPYGLKVWEDGSISPLGN